MNLNRIFTSHMVFAANKPIRIYGEGRGTVQVNFAGITKNLVSEDDKWRLELPPMEYGGPYTLKVVFENQTIVLEDIFIGEVYLFAGQSNMQFKMKETETSLCEIKSNNMIRLFSTDRIEDTDFFKSKDGWVVCKEEQIKEWSAIAYFTSKAVFESKNIAVGIIACYQGASVIESWVPEGAFNKIGINIPVADKHCDHTNFKKWNGDGVLYEYALSQVKPFSLSATVWYQGESDTSIAEGKVYIDELKELIRIWRENFDNSQLPFLIIQLADYIERKDEAWSMIQDAQLKIQDDVDNVYTVVSSDVCENDNIHPKTKNKLSFRIAEKLIQNIS